MKRKKKEKKDKETKKKTRFTAERNFNYNTMSSSMFFSWLRSGLRRMTVRGWKPISECKKLNRIPYVGDNKRMRWSYICSNCGGTFSEKEIAIHHKIPVGSLKTFEDLPGFCKRLFCEIEDLTLICDTCHTRIHAEEKQKEIENNKNLENEI